MTANLYYYSARSQAGDLVRGAMRARSQEEAIERLRGRRLFVTSFDDGRTLRGRIATVLQRAAVRGADRTAFIRSLSVLVGAGTPLLRALGVAASYCKSKNFAETVDAITADIRDGSSLSEAMERRPDDFPGSIVAMVRAGEVGGILDEVLQRSAAILERDEAVRRQLTATLAYPVFVLCAAATLVLFLLVAAVPGLAAILAQLHAEIPLPTRVLLWASVAIRTPATWTLACAATVGGFALLWQFGRVPAFLKWVDRRTLRLPVVGPVRQDANVAAFSRTVGALLQCGVPVRLAIETAMGVASSEAYKDAAADIVQALNEGTPLSMALGETRLFGTLCVEMAAIGEEAGSLDTMLLRVAEHLESELGHSLRSATAVLEPTLILALGAVVGGIISSVLIPLYAAIGSLH